MRRRYAVLFHYSVDGIEHVPQEPVSRHWTRRGAERSVRFLTRILERAGRVPPDTEVFYEVVDNRPATATKAGGR